jgi:hypothetical protein
MTQTVEIVHLIFSIHYRGIIDINTEYFSPIAIYHFMDSNTLFQYEVDKLIELQYQYFDNRRESFRRYSWKYEEQVKYNTR